MAEPEAAWKILELRLYMESSDFIFNYTGKLSKTIVITEAPHVERFFRPVKGFYKPLRVSPPVRGDSAVVPTYEVSEVEGRRAHELKPVALSGEYTIEVGSTGSLIDELYKAFREAAGVVTRLKFENAVVRYVVENVRVVEPEVRVERGAVVRTLSPALLTNPFAASQHVRRFTVSPSVVLWIPYSLASSSYSHDTRETLRALAELESCLAEHYSTRFRTVFVNYDGSREPAIELRAKYVVTRSECRETVERVLRAARVFGIGASRASGFGSVLVRGY